MHFVVYVLALRVEPLEDLCQHVDRLLAAQTRALGLELLQQVFGGHRLADQVAADGVLGQLHVAARERRRRRGRESGLEFSGYSLCLQVLQYSSPLISLHWHRALSLLWGFQAEFKTRLN